MTFAPPSDLQTGFAVRPAPRRGRRRVSGADGVGINELADSLGITPRALRYYEQVDLIRPDRTRHGARAYCPRVRREIELIVILRQTGHTAPQIRGILEEAQSGDEGAGVAVAAALEGRLAELERHVDRVREMLSRFSGRNAAV